MCSQNTKEAAGRGRRLPGRGACALADAHGTGGRARHRRTRTAPADAHGTGRCARHRRTRTAPADAHGIGGRAQHAHLRAPAHAHVARGRGKARERERVRTSQTGGGMHCHSDTILWRQMLMQVGGHWQGMHRVDDGNFKLLHEGRRTCRRVGGDNDLK